MGLNISKGKALLLIVLIVITGITVGIYFYEQYQKNKIDVNIAYIEGDLHHLTYYVAQEKGFYKNAGLNVQGLGQPNGGAIMNSFIANQIDMAYLGFAPLVFTRFNNPGARVKVLSAVNVEGSALIVKNSPSIQNASDLNGTKIAVPAANNMQDFILSMVLDLGGIPRSNITLVTMSVSQMPLALETGDIDGYVAWEPFAVKGLNNSIGKYLYNSSTLWPDHPCCVLAVHEDFLASNSPIVEKVVQVHKETTEWILTHWNEAMEIAMQKMNLNAEQASTAMSNVKYVWNVNKTQMISFVDKVIQFNPNVNFSSPGIPSDITNSTAFIDWLVKTDILEKLK